jgi:hypothetical protein
MAKSLFPNHPVVLKENPYFLDIQDELALMSYSGIADCDGISILYVCEPVREHAKLRYQNERYWGYVEEEALRYFLTNVSVLGESVKRIQIRPHPSENIEKYNWAQSEFELPIVAGGIDPLLVEIMASDVVVGCESMAMVIALLANKRVISCIPPGGRDCVLPQPKIENFRNLINRHICKG